LLGAIGSGKSSLACAVVGCEAYRYSAGEIWFRAMADKRRLGGWWFLGLVMLADGAMRVAEPALALPAPETA